MFTSYIVFSVRYIEGTVNKLIETDGFITGVAYSEKESGETKVESECVSWEDLFILLLYNCQLRYTAGNRIWKIYIVPWFFHSYPW